MLMCLLLQLFMDGYVADTFPAAYITALLKHPHWWLLHSVSRMLQMGPGQNEGFRHQQVRIFKTQGHVSASRGKPSRKTLKNSCSLLTKVWRTC